MKAQTAAGAALEQATAACRAVGRTQLTEWETYEILRAWNIPAAPCRVAATPAEAVEAARELGLPVAVKILSPEIAHKTDAGCVRLNLATADAVTAACQEILLAARRHRPRAHVTGILVQRMAPPGVELILGGTNDPSFGPVLMAGLGGIFTEVLRDVAFRLAPVTASEAEGMLRELKGFPLLTGARGTPAVDLEALVEVLTSLSRLINAWPALQELDLNPLIAHERGVLAVDGMVRLKA